MANIDRNIKIPLYKQIYDDINRRIASGEYALGSMLPSEHKLCAIYGVERATVRKALAMMVDDGKITKVQGLGTSVLHPDESLERGKQQNLLFLLQRGLDNSDRINEPFNAKLMNIMDNECAKRGYTLLYKPLSENDTVDDLVRSCNPCGVFYTSSLPIDMYRSLIHKGIPAVLVNHNHPIYPSVCLDNRGGAKMVVEYLYELGHRKIGFVTGLPRAQISTSRLNGFKEGLASNGLALNEDWIIEGDYSMESGKAAIRKFVANKNMPTALFTANDSMAIGVIMEAMSLGISVPDDISVVGFDNIDQSALMNPPLTTVAVDYSTMSRAASMLMLDMINNDNSELNVNIYIPLSLVERESVRMVE